MANCNTTKTPVDTESKLGSDGDPISDPTLYRSLAGGLQYLTFTHPDISYAVQQVCLYMHDPREPYLAALKRVLRYVRGILDFGLQLYASITGSLVAYTDADWTAKRQHTLSRSSAEAEYRGVSNVVAETAWLRNLLRELHTPLLSATLVYCDNVSAIYMTTNPVQHQRTKHIEVDIHFICDMVACGQWKSTGVFPGLIEHFKKSHQKNEKWFKEIYETRYNRMLKLRASQEGLEVRMTDDEIMDKVLGTNRGFKLGRGRKLPNNASSSSVRSYPAPPPPASQATLTKFVEKFVGAHNEQMKDILSQLADKNIELRLPVPLDPNKFMDDSSDEYDEGDALEDVFDAGEE
ncbi:ribonuclease H-like domain-containing protein [Tanacetum coccineum]